MAHGKLVGCIAPTPTLPRTRRRERRLNVRLEMVGLNLLQTQDVRVVPQRLGQDALHKEGTMKV